jgi:hypothetical protein
MSDWFGRLEHFQRFQPLSIHHKTTKKMRPTLGTYLNPERQNAFQQTLHPVGFIRIPLSMKNVSERLLR